MVEVNLELEVPTSLEDIELWQYQKYMGIVKQNEEATNPEAVDFVNRKLIEIFCDVSLKDVMNIPLKEYSKITEVLSNAFDADTPLVQRFELEGIEFGFIPNLDKMSLGEYIDIEKNILDWQNIHIAMGALFRPITKEYDDKYRIEKYEAKEEYFNLMKFMPVSVAMGAMVFFYRLGKDLSIHTLKSLEKARTTGGLTIQEQQTLEQNGVGISRFTHLLKGMFLNSGALLKPQFINV